MPNLRNESMGGRGDQRWLANTHGLNEAVTANLPVSGFTKETHYPNGHIVSGTPVDYTDTKAVTPYTGTGRLGFVLFDVPVYDGAENVAAAVLTHGIIKTANVPGDFTAPDAPGPFTFAGTADNEEGAE